MISHVTILGIEQMLGSSAANPVEMLEAARAQLRVHKDPGSGFKIQVAAPELTPLSLMGGLQVTPNCLLSDIQKTDLIVVPALWRKPKDAIKHHMDSSIPWLREQYRAGASIVAVGTGVTLLAEAGILDGKAATTHWHYLEQFARDYPKVMLQTKYLLTQADRIYCAASVNAAADMMVHWITLVFGKDLAMKVEQQFSPEARSSFEHKVFHAELVHQHPDEAIALVQSWMQQNLLQVIKLETLAGVAQLGVRQFSRRFRQVTGKTPGEYQQLLRCNAARDLLQESDMSIADVGALVGYQDASHFGRIFRRHNNQTPIQYRNKVRHKLFHG